MKILSGEQRQKAIQDYLIKCGQTEDEAYELAKIWSLKSSLADALLEAQARETAAVIFKELDSLIHEPLPSTRLSNNFGVIIRESYDELKKSYLEGTLQNRAKSAEYLTSISQAQKED